MFRNSTIALFLAMSTAMACVSSSPTTSIPGGNEPERPNPTPEPENPLNCFQLNPRETSDPEAVAFPGQWFVSAQKIFPGGKVSDDVIADSQTDYTGITTLCIKKVDMASPILLTATHSVFPATPFTLRRLLTPTPIPPPSPAPTPSAQQAPLTIDLLTTHLADLVMDIYELPFSGSVAAVTPETLSSIEATLRDDGTVRDNLEDFTLSQAEVREAWNDNIRDISGVAQGRACLTSLFPTNSLSGSADFTFPGGLPEDFPKGNDTSLDTDGSLFELAGIALDDMTVTVNGVDLNATFDSFRTVDGDLSGALMTATNFDPGGTLDAEFSMVNIHNAYNEDVLVPCVVGFFKITNRGSDDFVATGSNICIDAVGAGDLFQIPSNGVLGSAPDKDTAFMVFGDDGDGHAWVVGAPGTGGGAQKDEIGFSVSGDEVCIQFAGNHELGTESVDDTLSLAWFLCVVEGGDETLAASRVNSSSRGMFDVGTQPAFFGEAALDEKEIADQIGRSDFMFNPDVITFMDKDIRDSLVNHFGGNQPNVFFVGQGFNAEYDVTLNGSGETLAKIVTGPEGQWSGAVVVDDAALGGFLRFSEHGGDLQNGHYFDLPIAPSCMPGPPPGQP